MARPYIITISSEKGGVGKTTLATNLAIYLKHLAGDTPVTIFSFDNHFTVDRMFLPSLKNSRYHVGHLFLENDATELTLTGEHGVQVIPSCRDLQELQKGLNGYDLLAECINRSNLSGLVIIDTSPVLDTLTKNALFTADRVIVPVKDAPSLENCKNLGRFFTDNGLPKSTLRLLPCLIDTRIHYKGPFKDPYQLLKAYSINRGFRCMEGFISKSPKVESLNTNPEGRVYPILTHGRATDVHLQFMHLARQVYLEYLEHGPSRIGEIASDLTEMAIHIQQEIAERKQRLDPRCLSCGKPFPEEGPWEHAFYVESTEADHAGFIEDDCVTDLIFRSFYGQHKGIGALETMIELFRESASRSYFVLHQSAQNGNGESLVEFGRLDDKGNELSSKSLSVKESGLGLLRMNTHPVLDFLDRVFGGPLTAEKRTLLLRRTGQTPYDILSGTAYVRWQTILSRTLMEQSVARNQAVDSMLQRQP